MGFDLSKIGVKQNIPKVNFTDYCGLIIAEPKFGKTTMASMYPNAIIAPFEEGYLATVSNVVEGMNTWDDFIDFVDKLEENREEIGEDIKTVVFDTINEAYSKCEPYTLRQLSKLDGKKYNRPADVPHGQFYPARDNNIKIQIDRLLKMGFMPLFITHSEIKTITPKDGQPYDVYSSTMNDRLEKIINPLVSYIIFGERRKVDDGMGNKISKRALVVKSNDMMTAGSRVRLDNDIIFDTEEEAMEKFQSAFKDMIQEKLNKAGIKENIDKLAKQQQKEKIKAANEYIKSSKKPTNEELVDVIKEKFPSVNEEQKTEIQTIMEEYSIKNFKDADKLSNEGLQKIVDVLNK